MAVSVLRRKRFFSGTLGTTANTVVFTAGTAPADGAAKATFTFTLANKTSSAATATVQVTSSQINIVNAISIAGNDTYVHGVAVDLMGGETLLAWSNTSSAIDMCAMGFEASDS